MVALSSMSLQNRSMCHELVTPILRAVLSTSGLHRHKLGTLLLQFRIILERRRMPNFEAASEGFGVGETLEEKDKGTVTSVMRMTRRHLFFFF